MNLTVVDILSSTNLGGAFQKLKSSNRLSEVIQSTHFLDQSYDNVTWSQRFWHIKNGRFEIIKCDRCNKNQAKWCHGNSKYVSCSNDCKQSKINHTLNGLYNSNDYLIIRDKATKTCIERYKVDHPSKTENFKNSITETYGKKFIAGLNPNYELVKYDDTIELIHLNCGNKFKIGRRLYALRKFKNITYCSYCYKPTTGISIGEKELLYFIKSIYEYEVRSNYRSFNWLNDGGKNLELDIYIPKLKIAIEFNEEHHKSKHIARRDRLKKDLCDDNGVSLVTVLKHDWFNNTAQVKNHISSLLK